MTQSARKGFSAFVEDMIGKQVRVQIFTKDNADHAVIFTPRISPHAFKIADKISMDAKLVADEKARTHEERQSILCTLLAEDYENEENKDVKHYLLKMIEIIWKGSETHGNA